MSASFVTLDSSLPRLLCPWGFPGKNTGVGCPFLLQGIFLTQGSNLCLLRFDSLLLSHQGSSVSTLVSGKMRGQSQDVLTPESLPLTPVIYYRLDNQSQNQNVIFIEHGSNISTWRFREGANHCWWVTSHSGQALRKGCT